MLDYQKKKVFSEGSVASPKNFHEVILPWTQIILENTCIYLAYGSEWKQNDRSEK